MFYYFLGIDGKPDLNKAILLTGGHGPGKTTLFRVMRNFINQVKPHNENAFVISSIEEIITYGNGINESPLLMNIKNDIASPVHLLVNEFGHKYKIKTYGSEVDDIVESFFMKRYDIFQQHKKVTHITTNLSKEDLLENYGPVLIDRFKEMFNIVELNCESFRK